MTTRKSSECVNHPVPPAKSLHMQSNNKMIIYCIMEGTILTNLNNSVMNEKDIIDTFHKSNTYNQFLSALTYKNLEIPSLYVSLSSKSEKKVQINNFMMIVHNSDMIIHTNVKCSVQVIVCSNLNIQNLDTSLNEFGISVLDMNGNANVLLGKFKIGY